MPAATPRALPGGAAVSLCFSAVRATRGLSCGLPASGGCDRHVALGGGSGAAPECLRPVPCSPGPFPLLCGD